MAFAAFGATAGATTGGGAARETAPLKRSAIAIGLLAPGIVYLLLFFVTPFVSMVITSLNQAGPTGAKGDYVLGFQWQNYVDALTQYGPHFLRSFGYSLTATILTLLIGFPVAYFIGVTARKWPLVQSLALCLVIAPFFISFLLRTLAWQHILASNGPIVELLQTVGLFGPTDKITGTDFAVIFGITYNYLPFMILPLYASLERLDLRLLEAGSDLYARPATRFFRVTLPITMPGVVSGTLLTFIPAAGDYINSDPNYLGSPKTAMVGNVIQAQFLNAQDYPLASAVSVALMVIILIVVAVYIRFAGTEELV